MILYGVYDSEYEAWLSDEDGPKTWSDKAIADTKRIATESRYRYPAGRLVVKPYVKEEVIRESRKE